MSKLYLITGILVLICHRAMPQHGEVYASSRLQPPDASAQSYSLKHGLSQIQKMFDVSIAYKDEWVKDKMLQIPLNFSSVEKALDAMLQNTGLNYEKAGERFYIIFEKRQHQSSTYSYSSPMPLVLNASSSSSGDFATTDLSSTPVLTTENAAITVTGHVTDESGSAFPGINVIVKGTTIGSSTDSDGRYSVSVPDENAVLVFSFIGYSTQEIVVGSRTVIDVAMQPNVKSLDEVVVTALGIERSSKSLGYATAQVSSEQFAINRSPNIMNTLQGKIAGVNIAGLGTGPAGTSKIRIRGQSSISGQNNPLIVINGVPIDNTNFGTNQGNTAGDNSIANRGGGASTDGGDGLSSINPDDVESMTVLKGAAAAALYGSRAKDGVIMVTTKTKGTHKGIGVTYNMNYTNEKPLDYTDYQYVYGQGENGQGPSSPGALPNPTTGQWSFGPKIEPGMTQLLYNNVVVPYVAQKGIINQFYRHGQNLTNSVSLSFNTLNGMVLAIAYNDVGIELS